MSYSSSRSPLCFLKDPRCINNKQLTISFFGRICLPFWKSFSQVILITHQPLLDTRKEHLQFLYLIYFLSSLQQQLYFTDKIPVLTWELSRLLVATVKFENESEGTLWYELTYEKNRQFRKSQSHVATV